MAEDYIPFGEEWEKEMMKMTKKQLVGYIKRVCQEKKKEEERISRNREFVHGDHRPTKTPDYQKPENAHCIIYCNEKLNQ